MIPDIEPVNTWSGNSSATRFDFDFLINNASELTVLHTDSDGVQTKLELNTDYTINQIGQEDGSYITFPIVGSTYSVLSSSEKISLLLDIPVAQTSPYGTSSRLDLDSLEYSLDYLTRLIQIQKRQVERSVKVQEGSDISTDTLALNLNKVADISTDVSTVAGSISNVQNVSSNITNVNYVGNDITNVNAVAADLTNLDAIAGDLTNIDTVAGSIADVNAVGGSISNVNTVAADLTNIDTVATSIVDVIAVATDITNVNAVADDLTNIDTVKAGLTNIGTVAGSISNVNAVGGAISNVNSVASDLTNINAVKADLTNIDSVAGNLTNINAVKNNATNINTVAGASSNINSVVTNISNIDSVAGNLTNINAVKNNATNINTVATNISNVNSVGGAISDISAVAADLTNIDTAVENLSQMAVIAEAVDLAQDWANKTDGPVDGTEYSAKYYAQQSAQGQVQANWNEADTTSKSYIQNKPSLSTVATTGSYSDLTSTPTFSTGLTNTSGTITVTDYSNLLKNTATGSNSTTIEGSATAKTYAVNLGKSSEAGGAYGTALGAGAYANASNATAVGYCARVTATSSIQLGYGTTTTTNQLYVGFYNANKNWNLLDGTTGYIPNARLNTLVGADGTNAGTAGIVPAPTATDNTKFLKGDGTWSDVPGGGGSVDIDSSTITLNSSDEIQAVGFKDDHNNDTLKVWTGTKAEYLAVAAGYYYTNGTEVIYTKTQYVDIDTETYTANGEHSGLLNYNFYAWTNTSLSITVYTDTETPTAYNDVLYETLTNGDHAVYYNGEIATVGSGYLVLDSGSTVYRDTSLDRICNSNCIYALKSHGRYGYYYYEYTHDSEYDVFPDENTIYITTIGEVYKGATLLSTKNSAYWVKKDKTIRSNANPPSSPTDSYIGSYFDDSGCHEVLFYYSMTTSTTSGEGIGIAISSSLMGTVHIDEVYTQASSSNTVSGFFVFPVGTNNTITLSRAFSSATGTYTITAKGYRTLCSIQ